MRWRRAALCLNGMPESVTAQPQLGQPTRLPAPSPLGAGYGLHWEDLDVDLSVPGLLSGLLGTAGYMAGRAGRSTSPAKAAAARANGARGGRPRRPA